MMAQVVVQGTAVVAETGARTKIPWWSFTKTVIAAAALALVAGGRLSLDDGRRSRGYSLRHLLQHRAGLGDYGELADYHRAVERRETPWPVAELLARTDGL